LEQQRAFQQYFISSAFFRKLVLRISSSLLTKFPEYVTKNEKIKNYIEKNKNKLEALFKSSVHDYVKYGSCFLKHRNNFLEKDFKNNNTYVVNDILFQDSNISYEENGVVPEAIAYYQDKSFLIWNDRVDLINSECVNSNFNLSIFDETPFVANVSQYFITMEELQKLYLDTIPTLKTVLLCMSTDKDKIRDIFDSNSFNVVGLDVNVFQSGDIRNLSAWFDNTPIANTLQIQKQKIEDLQNEIINVLDLQDLFTDRVKDNSNETRVAAQNRISVSNISWTDKQNKVNLWIENSLKYLILKELQIPIEENDLELNSNSILEKEITQQKKESDLGKIVGLVQQLVQSPPEFSNFYFNLIDDTISNSQVSNQIKESLDIIKKSTEDKINQSIQMSSQPPVPPPPLPQDIKVMAEVEKIKAETMKIVEETKTIPIKSQVEVAEQTQQSLDSQRINDERALKMELQKKQIENLQGINKW